MKFKPAGSLQGTIEAPPDKSISHRVTILAAMSSGLVRINNYLFAADTNSTLAAVELLGAQVRADRAGVTVRGIGLRDERGGSLQTGRLSGENDGRSGPVRIDVGNSGTLARVLPGWLVGRCGSWIIDGDESVRRRPMERVIEPLSKMGAQIESPDGKRCPFEIRGGQLNAITYRLPVASAQVKTCLLLAGLLAEGTTELIEPHTSRDHTERMLRKAGVDVVKKERRIKVNSTKVPEVSDITVPGDPSSAAFFMTAAILIPGSKVTITNVASNWTRHGFTRAIKRMGANVEAGLEPVNTVETSEEPVTDIVVSSSKLTGITIDPHEVPLLIDELPLIALLACFADGETVVHGAEELRHKESDRISAIVDGLSKLGADIEASPDGFRVRGGKKLKGGRFDSHSDHRLAMLGAIAGLASKEGVDVIGMESAAVSYPNFIQDLEKLRQEGIHDLRPAKATANPLA